MTFTTGLLLLALCATVAIGTYPSRRKAAPALGGSEIPDKHHPMWGHLGDFLDRIRGIDHDSRVIEMANTILALTYENDNLAKALEFYKADDEKAVESHVLESVYKRPATTALLERSLRLKKETDNRA